MRSRAHLRLVTADPLPECPMCERPTRRDVYAELGLCTDCAEAVAAVASRLPPRKLPPAPQ